MSFDVHETWSYDCKYRLHGENVARVGSLPSDLLIKDFFIFSTYTNFNQIKNQTSYINKFLYLELKFILVT